MTTQEKQTLRTLRLSGLTFAEIAARTGMPVSTIKSYCYRHPVTAEPEIPTISGCPQCGAEIPKTKFRPRKFCSDACRQKYWNTHPEQLARKTIVSITCKQCGKPFVDYPGRGRKFCCHACYIAARYGGGAND